MANESSAEESPLQGTLYGLTVRYVNSYKRISPSTLHPILPPNIRWVVACVSLRAADRRMERMLMANGHEGVIADFIRAQEPHN
jgi:hypothetical protein